MKFHVRHILAKFGEADVLTHTLPYEARFRARHG